MINPREVDFNEETFRDFYNEWMKPERNIVPAEESLSYGIGEDTVLNYIKRDFDNPSISCLDIGCANGWFLIRLKKQGIIEYGKGIDISDLMIDYARQSAINYEVDLGFENISFENYQISEKFDIITMFDVFEHFKDITYILDKTWQALNPLGFFYGKIPFGNTTDALPHLQHFDTLGLGRLLSDKFNRISIIKIDLYENAKDHEPEYNLVFRCQRSENA